MKVEFKDLSFSLKTLVIWAWFIIGLMMINGIYLIIKMITGNY